MIACTVMFYGQSLLLSGVASGLGQYPDLQVAQAVTWAEACRLLREHIPDVLIFDLSEPCESQILPLLLKNPHPLLVGLDVERNQAVLLSGQEAHSLTLNDIKEIVEMRGLWKISQAPESNG